MLQFLPQLKNRQLTILLLGAHCDDIEIGCGGSLMGWVAKYPSARYVWITLSSDSKRAAETRVAAAQLLKGVRNVVVKIETFRGSYFPQAGTELKEYFETLKAYAPHLIITHYRHDLHQDHRVVNELTWNTFRNHTIIEYEIPKYDGDLGTPNVYVPLARDVVQRKCDLLLDCFASQRERPWFTRETFMAIARLRGIECQAPEGFAEAFYGRKICLAT